MSSPKSAPRPTSLSKVAEAVKRCTTKVSDDAKRCIGNGFSPNELAAEERKVQMAAAALVPALMKIAASPRQERLQQNALSRMTQLGNSLAVLRNESHAIMERDGLKPTASNRSSFVSTLPELIGQSPNRVWQDEWLLLNVATGKMFAALSGGPIDEAKILERASTFTIEEKLRNFAGEIKWKTEEQGWTLANAEAHTALTGSNGAVMADAMRAKDPKFAAATYALYTALATASLMQGTRGEMPPRVYHHMTGGPSSAQSRAPKLAHIQKADAYGFKGFTCYAELPCSEDPNMFAEDGTYLPRAKFKEGKPVYEPSTSDVLCMISRPEDATGLHSVIHTWVNEWRAPPNTLFRLLKIHEAGTWQPRPGVFPNVRCFDVTMTYLANPASIAALQKTTTFIQKIPLQFADRQAYARGTHELTSSPVLTLEQEWLRNNTWRARDGSIFNSNEEWAYVKGIAGTAPQQSGSIDGEFQLTTFAGQRDVSNEGMSAQDFVERANDFLRKRAKAINEELSPDSFLTMDEVLSLRLYTGPAFQPLNLWLRNVGRLDAFLRVSIAQDSDITYGATVGAICSALRKLARVGTPELDGGARLWRGIGGNLADAFWLPDASGLLCITELGLMSTSTGPDTPKHYMREGMNVLWNIISAPEDEAGFHCGADVSLLSQYPAEREVLFPPLTLFNVARRNKGNDGNALGRQPDEMTLVDSGLSTVAQAAASDWQIKLAKTGENDEKKYLEINVIPTFV